MTTSTALTLSKSWRVQRTHSDTHTGGRVRPVAPGTMGGGRVVASWCSESVKVVDLDTGLTLHTIGDPDDAVLAHDCHPTRAECVTVQRSGLMRIWNLETGERLREWKGPRLPVTCVSYSPSGTLVVTGGVDRSVRVWNAEKGFATHVHSEHGDMVTVVKFHPDAAALLVLSGARDGSVFAYDLRTQQCARMTAHTSHVTAILIDAERDLLISAGRDQILNVTGIASGATKQTLPVMEEIEAMGWIPDSATLPFSRPTDIPRIFMTVGARRAPRYWSIPHLRCLHTGPALPAALTNVIVAESDFIVTCADHNFHLVSFPTGTVQRCIIGYNDDIFDARFLRDGRRVAIATNSELIRVMDVTTFDAALLAGHTDIVVALAVSPCGLYLASASKDNTLRIWDLTTGACTTVAEGHTASVTACAWPVRSSTFVCSASADRTLKRWAWNGRGLDGAPRTVLAHDADINAVAVAPNDKWIATASLDRTVKLWSSTDLEAVTTLRGHRRGVWSVAFSPTDRVLASAGADRTVRLWSLTDFSCVRTFEGHTTSVLRVAFLPHGMQLLTSGADALVKLWTIHTNECVATFEDQHEDRIWALDVSPDGTQLVTGAADSLIRVWRDTTADDAEAAREQDQQRVRNEQQLRDAVRARNHVTAAAIAIDLENPRRLFSVLEAIDDRTDFAKIVAGFVDDDARLNRVLGWLQEWNTAGRRAPVAQTLLKTILENCDAERWRHLRNAQVVVDALLSYSQRHFERVDKLLRKTFVIDYVVQKATSV